MLKILPAYPQMIYSYVKNTRSLRLMFAMIFSNFWKLRHAQESPSYYYYYLLLLLLLAAMTYNQVHYFRINHLVG